MAILDAGLIAGIGLPHNCRGGACGTCKSQVLEGSVDHGWVLSFAITDEEKAAGKCLICQSKPTSAMLVIRPDGAMAPAEEDVPAPIEASALVVASEALTPSIRRLVVALPKGVRFRYRAGMHVEIATPGVAKRRTYSIANAPDDDGLPPDGLLQFFVTRHPGGHASNWLHDGLGVGQPLAIHGPYGSFRWPKDAKGPVLCLAGGSGLAPILAVLQEALGNGYADPVSADPVGARPERAFCARCLPCAGPAPREFLLPGDVEPGGRGRSRHGLASRPDLRLAAGCLSRSLGLARAGRRPARLRRRMRRERTGPGGRRGAHPGGQLHADRGVRLARP